MGRPKRYERTVKIALTEEQWERIEMEAKIMRVAFADAVRMNIEVGFLRTMPEEKSNA